MCKKYLIKIIFIDIFLTIVTWFIYFKLGGHYMSNKKTKKLQNSTVMLTEHKLDDGTVVKLNPTVTRIILCENDKR